MKQEIFSAELLEQGRLFNEEKGIQEIQFAEGIYQVTCRAKNSGKKHFPVLYLDDKGVLIDALCDCSSWRKEKSCIHLAAAWIRIFGHSSAPMHVRFKNSFWYKLCLLCAKRWDYSSKGIKKVEAMKWRIMGPEQKVLFELEVFSEKERKHIAQILQLSSRPREERLKLSTLSPEEKALIYQGKAEEDLRYRLSFWFECASFLFLHADTGCFVDFSEGESDLPEYVRGNFQDFKASFILLEGDLEELIPSLAKLPSALRVFYSPYAPIATIDFSEETKRLNFTFETIPLLQGALLEKKMVSIGSWVYVSHLGFFPEIVDPLLNQPYLEKEELALFLDRYADVAREFMKGYEIDSTLIPLQYELKFVDNHGLKIEAYLFKKGDLQNPVAALFGNWAYLPGRGFYKVLLKGISSALELIEVDKLSSFIERHRLFINEHEGFQLHLTMIEARLDFFLDKENFLHFILHLEKEMEQEGVLDLGDFIYIEGRGFYPKVKHSGGIRAGLSISKKGISPFIKDKESELENIPGFFASSSPLKSAGLIISLNQREEIIVFPEYIWEERCSGKRKEIFEKYTYLEGEGFFPMEESLQLPEEYLQKKKIKSSQEAHFIFYQLERLEPFIVKIDPRLVTPKALSLKVNGVEPLFGKEHHYALDLMYESSLGSTPLSDIHEAISQKKKYLFTASGFLDLTQARFSVLEGCRVDGSSKLLLSTIDCFKLAAFEDLVNRDGSSLNFEAWQTILRGTQESRELSLEGLKSSLRSYQLTGVQWLFSLYSQGLSALLCDEMGLGKTHQAMALITAIRNQTKEASFLVVCPTSVIFHWQKLFEQFLPGIKTAIYHGPQRDPKRLKQGVEVIITSYGILRSDETIWEKHSFSLAVFDEIQVAKNSHSLTHVALRKISSSMRLGLTGTPIENRLADLKALFDIVLPGYLPQGAKFQELFGLGEVEEKQKYLLKKLTQPFILRRKKMDVLKELPEKTEEIYYCTLSIEQKDLYKKALENRGKHLLDDLQSAQKPISYVHVFALLGQLKQICDHPCLVLPEAENYFAHHSGKWELFVELLNEARESGQKIVVFSQFLKMLDIIEAYLDERGIGYAGIRGSTQDRKGEVERFHDDPRCEVFVASLLAAGVGIDLVSASVVIHYDRWWNPAKEDQATDRVHRIGQKRGVQVFKLVTKDTLEEEIDRIIERKKTLARESLNFDDESMLKQLDREELIALLRLSTT